MHPENRSANILQTEKLTQAFACKPKIITGLKLVHPEGKKEND